MSSLWLVIIMPALALNGAFIDQSPTTSHEYRDNLSLALQPLGVVLQSATPYDISLREFDFVVYRYQVAEQSYQTNKIASLAGMQCICLQCLLQDSSHWKSLVLDLMAYNGWSHAVIITDLHYATLHQEFSYSPNITSILISSDTPEKSIERLMARTVKTTGVRHIFVATQHDMSGLVLSQGNLLAMWQGYSYTLIDRACLHSASSLISGVLCIVKEGFEAVVTSVQYDAALLAGRLFGVRSGYSLLNIVEGRRFQVGSFLPSLSLSSSPIYPGGSLAPPNNSQITVLIGSVLSLPGDRVALQDHKPVLPRFAYKHQVFDCFDFINLPTYSACFPQFSKENVSLVFFGCCSFDALSGVYMMKLTGNYWPSIGAHVYYDPLSSLAEYPYFIRTVQAIEYFYTHIFRLIQLMRYKKINILFSDYLVFDRGQSFLDLIQASNIEIVTPKDLINIPQTPDPTYFDRVAEAVDKSGIRPLFLISISLDHFKLAAALFDRGLRADDISFYSTALDFTKDFQKEDPTVREKALHLLDSFLFTTPTSQFGEEGNRVSKLINLDSKGERRTDCLVYDAMKLALLTADAALMRGVPFSDVAAIMKLTRLFKFQGCTGTVSINYLDNNRRQMNLNVAQFILQDGVLVSTTAIEISIESSQVYFIYTPIVWPGGTTVIPPLFRLNYAECPYPVEWKKEFSEARKYNFMIGLCLVMVAVVSAVTAQRSFYRNVELEYPTSVFVQSTQDKLILITSSASLVLLQVFAPAHSLAMQVATSIIGSFITTKENYYDGGFFSLVNIVISILIIWHLCLILSWYRRASETLRHIAQWGVVAVSFGALPLTVFVSLLVYDCFDAYVEGAPSYADTVLDMDCYVECGKSSHILYSIGVSLVLLAFVIFSIVYVPATINRIEGTHVQLSSKFVQLKAILELTTVFLYKHMDYVGELAYSVATLALFCSFIVLSHIVPYINVQVLQLKYTVSMYAMLTLQIEVVLLQLFRRFDWATLTIVLGAAGVYGSLIVYYKVKAKRLPQLVTEGHKINANAWFSYAFGSERKPPSKKPNSEVVQSDIGIVSKPQTLKN